jgi:hypothetical protein
MHKHNPATPDISASKESNLASNSRSGFGLPSLLLSSLMSRALIAVTIIGLLWLVLLQLLG